MEFYKYMLVFMMMAALNVPVEAGWGRRIVRKVGREIKRVAKKVEEKAKEHKCTVVFGMACPAAIGAAAAAGSAGTAGTGTVAIAAGAAVAKNRICDVQKEKCKNKRSVNETNVLLPFSDDMSDYDFDGDKLITYTEFVWAVVRSVHMRDPDQLMEPFEYADFDGNGVLDTDEFNGAPFIFAHASISKTV